MSAIEFATLAFICGLAWFWYNSAGAREAGIKAARTACESEALQLLDDTVAIASLKVQRDDEGRIQLRRVYKFEFSDTGNDRRNGSVVLLGHRVIVVNIGLRLVASSDTLH